MKFTFNPKSIVVLLLVLVMVVGIQVTILAKAAETDVAGGGIVVVTPGVIQESGQTAHLRDYIVSSPPAGLGLPTDLSGDIEGTISLTLDAEINLNSLVGQTHGSFSIKDLDGEVIWEGSFTGEMHLADLNGTLVPISNASQLVGHGKGEFVGQKLFITSESGIWNNTPGVFALSYGGTILNPHG